MPAESVAFAYNGSNEIVATITAAVPGNFYSMWSDFAPYTTASAQAVTSTLVLTISDITGTALETEDVYVQKGNVPFATTDYIGGTVFRYGDTSEYPYAGLTWAFDGNMTVQVTGVFDLGVDYILEIIESAGGGNNTPFTGTGASQMVSVQTFGAVPAVGDYFLARVFFNDATFWLLSNRMFVAASASGGFEGNPTSAGQSVGTGAVDNISETSARLNAIGNPGGVASIGYFEYGPSASYGFQTASQALGSGTSPVAFNAIIGGLTASQTYYYRAVLDVA